jgi:tetratricopeptide (TPR) repeat protein
MPRHADALYNLGVACAEDGQTERALFCYELTTHFNPSCAEAWNNLGVLHKEADNLERAAECYMAALNIRPNFPQVRARWSGWWQWRRSPLPAGNGLLLDAHSRLLAHGVCCCCLNRA